MGRRANLSRVESPRREADFPGGAKLRQTPLCDEHLALGGKIVDFHGWALPLQFAGILEEHQHTRKQASLFDCSHMGEFLLTGTEAIQAFSAIICSDPVKLAVGRAKYGAMLLEFGGIIDDLITMKLAEDRLFVVTNAGPLEEVSRRIRACHSQARDISDQTAKVDIQGPLARDILAKEIPEAAALKYFQVRETTWKRAPIVLSRTGYTGELGYEIFVPNELAVPLWRKLLSYDPVKPAGLGARDTLRTEVCYALSRSQHGRLHRMGHRIRREGRAESAASRRKLPGSHAHPYRRPPRPAPRLRCQDRRPPGRHYHQRNIRPQPRPRRGPRVRAP
jgi:glycine cleavage system T protein